MSMFKMTPNDCYALIKELIAVSGTSRHNTRSQATTRRAIRRRSNLPRAIQKRLGFKCK